MKKQTEAKTGVYGIILTLNSLHAYFVSHLTAHAHNTIVGECIISSRPKFEKVFQLMVKIR